MKGRDLTIQQLHSSNTSLIMPESGPLCLPLAGSAMCPDFVQFYAYIPSTVSQRIKDVASFDQVMKESVSTSNTSVGFGTLARDPNGYNCTGWDGTGLRYFQSTLCAYFVGMGMRHGTSEASRCNQPDQSIPLCAKTASKFVDSWNIIQYDKKACPFGPSTGATYYRDAILSNLQGLLSNSSTCLVGEISDVANCGFESKAEFTSFCSSADVDSCCANSNLSSKFITSSATRSSQATEIKSKSLAAPGEGKSIASATVAPVVQSGNENASSTKFPIPAIAAATVGGLLLVAAGVIAVRFRRRRAEPKDVEVLPLEARRNNFSKQDERMSRLEPRYVYNGGIPEVLPIGSLPTPQVPASPIMIAKRGYRAQLNDEIDIIAGDELVLETRYEDGWAYGFKVGTNEQGVFPLSLFESQSPAQKNNDGDRSTVVESLYSSRTSSLYIAPSTVTVDRVTAANNKFDSVYTKKDSKVESVYARPWESLPGSKLKHTSTGSIPIDEHTAMFSFSPQQSDEIVLMVGDTVKLIKEYDDGWGYGVNLKTQLEGLFPLDCLEEFSQDNQEESDRPIRVSSIYGFYEK
ncbi:hypothetical protein BC830DRAFT_1140373 [Chytriomyces sp. MP71]|nr:hypothetical protein BC830DRAFT_1140373 [Chytriomyces sp. MP71]